MDTVEEVEIIERNGIRLRELTKLKYISGSFEHEIKHRKKTAKNRRDGKNDRVIFYLKFIVLLFKKYEITITIENVMKLKFLENKNLFELCALSVTKSREFTQDLLEKTVRTTFNVSKSQQVILDFEREFGGVGDEQFIVASEKRPDLLKGLIEDSDLPVYSKAKALARLGDTSDEKFYEYVMSKRGESNDIHIRQASYMGISEIYEKNKEFVPKNILEILSSELTEAGNKYLVETIEDTIYNIKYAD